MNFRDKQPVYYGGGPTWTEREHLKDIKRALAAGFLGGLGLGVVTVLVLMKIFGLL